VTISSIVGSTYTGPSTGQPASTQAPTVTQSVSPAHDTTDTVHLSVDAQVKQLSESGESASTIANTTGLTEAEVDIDLDITTSSSSTLAAAPSGSGGGHGAAAKAAPAAAAAPETATTSPAPAATVSVRA